MGVKVDRNWIGTTDAERKARQRALRRLENCGLLELFAVTGRGISHVRLTEKGVTQFRVSGNGYGGIRNLTAGEM